MTTSKIAITSHMLGGTDARSWRKLRKLLHGLRQGMTLKAAAAFASIAPRTVETWRERGNAGEAGYVRLSDAIQRASDYWEAETVAGLSASRVRDPKVAMWMLERNPNTRDWRASETVTDAAVGLGQLFQAMRQVHASAEPARLGSAVPGAAGVPLPLLEEVREVREVEEEAGSNSEHQEQQQ